MRGMRIAALLSIVSVFGLGCQSAGQHRKMVQDDSSDRMTVANVQREVRVGMSGAEVIEALGSPNVVTTDEQRREVWIYDKISTDTVYSRSQGGVSALVFGLFNPVGVGGSANASGAAGARSTSQRTLTVLIKFDSAKRVRDFAYHTSRF